MERLFAVVIPPNTEMPDTGMSLGPKMQYGLATIHPKTKKAVLQLQNLPAESALKICQLYAPVYGGDLVQLVPVPVPESGPWEIEPETAERAYAALTSLLAGWIKAFGTASGVDEEPGLKVVEEDPDPSQGPEDVE